VNPVSTGISISAETIHEDYSSMGTSTKRNKSMTSLLIFDTDASTSAAHVA